MKLVFVLPPHEAGRLAKLKLLSGLKAGRWRHRTSSIAWHDTAELALAADGLSLAEREGDWRLQSLVPGEAFWPPGTPPPVLEQAASLEQIGRELPAGLHKVATFDGRMSTLALQRDGAPLALELLQGRVGWARRRRPACRLSLEGDEPAVLALARELTAELAIQIPIASLAAEACAVAKASAPPDRHEGPPRLRAGLTVAEAFTHALGHLTDVILTEAQRVLAGPEGLEPAHQLRVAVRRLRSTIAVFRPAIACPLVDSTNLGLEALGDRVAPARDWDVFVAETCAQVEQALPDDTGLRRLHAGAERRRREAYAALRSWLQGADFRQLGVALAGLAGGEAWLIPVDAPQQEARGLELETFGSQALRRRLRRLTEAGEAIEHLDAEALHAIRLRAKRMRYAAEVFAPVFPGRPARRFLRRLANLQDCLGVLNDGTVADALLGELGADRGARAHAAGLVRGFLAARAGQARGQIGRAWQRFRRLEPFWT